jgi:hypothetical protein
MAMLRVSRHYWTWLARGIISRFQTKEANPVEVEQSWFPGIGSQPKWYVSAKDVLVNGKSVLIVPQCHVTDSK